MSQSVKLCLFLIFVTFNAVFQPSVAATSSDIAEKRLRFQNFNIEQGLSQSTVITIEQDSLGYMWFGTQDGLNRFDGVDVDILKHEPLNQNTLSSSFINSIQFDGKETLWVLTDSGIDSINVFTLEVTRWAFKIESLIWKNRDEDRDLEMWGFAIHSSGDVSVLTDFGVAEISLNQSTVRINERVSDFVDGKDFHRLSVIGDNLYFNKDKCLYSISFSGSNEKTYCAPEEITSLKLLVQDSDLLALFHRNGFSIFNARTNEITFHKIKDARFNSNVEIKHIAEEGEHYWLASISGLKLYDPQAKEVVQEYYADFSDSYSIASDYGHWLHRSDDGVIWLGTGAGVSFWEAGKQFVHLLQKREVTKFKHSNTVTTILKSHTGKLWLGTVASGIYQYDENYNNLTHHPELNLTNSVRKTGYISHIIEDVNNTMWITSSNGLFIKHENDTEFKFIDQYIEDENSQLDLKDISAIEEDTNGDMWIGRKEGLYKVSYDPSESTAFEDSFDIIDYSQHIPKSMINTQFGIYAIYRDIDGDLWLGGSGGLVRLDPRTLEYDYYKSTSSDPRTLSSSDVNTIYQDSNGVIWVGTVSGLNRVRFDRNGELYFQRVTVNDGFVNDYVCSILGDQDGNLWVSTANGLVKYHPEQGMPVNYTYMDGIQYDEFFTNADLKDSEGNLYFGGLNGVSVFDPTEVESDKAYQPIKLTELKQSGAGLEFVQNGTDYYINVEEKGIVEVKVSVFDFLSAKKIQYRYKIEELSDRWVNLDSSRQIRLHNLDFDELAIKIQMRHADGYWNPQFITLHVNVHQMFLKTPLGMALMLLVIAIVLGTLVYILYRKASIQLAQKDTIINKLRRNSKTLRGEKMALAAQLEDMQYTVTEQNYETESLTLKLAQKEMFDVVTGFRSKHYFKSQIGHELETILDTWKNKGQEKGIHLGIFIVDIDNLKLVNAKHGHIAGNELIRQVADMVKNICYGTDTLVRWEGASLLIMSRGIARREQMILAEKIRNITASKRFNLGNGSSIDATCSIGFTRFPFIDNPQKVLTWDQIAFIAETALKVAKKNSKNAWIGVFSNQFTRYQELRAKLSIDLPALIVSGQFDYVSSIPKSKKISWERR